MRPDDGSPLDLNNLPEDFNSRDGKQVLDQDSTSSGYRKKKSGGNKDGKDEPGKVYECRFCSLKFCKSQALGGHMNRHRQERETETLNRARQLVYNNDNLATPGAHLGCHPMAAPGVYHAAIGDPFRTMYPSPRLYSGSSPTPTHQHHHHQQQQQQQPYLYTSPSRIPSYPSSQYPPPPHQQQQPINDYYIGHVMNNSAASQTYPPAPSHPNMNYNNVGTTSPHGAPDYSNSNHYTCIGAPVGVGGFGRGSSRGSDGSGRDGPSLMSNQDQEAGLMNWGGGGRSFASSSSGAAAGGSLPHQHLDVPPSINRFQDGF